MSHAVVTELEWCDGSKHPEDRGWRYCLMGEPGSDLLTGLDADAGHEEIVEALHEHVRADRIEIDLGAVPDDD